MCEPLPSGNQAIPLRTKEFEPTGGKVLLRHDVIERGGVGETWFGGGAGS